MKRKSNDSKRTFSNRGTIASLTIMALVIILMWVGVFAIYMDRV